MTREEIKSARTLRKLSQAALAKLTHLSASEISRIECGYRDMTDAEAATIAAVLDLKPKGMAKAAPAARTAVTSLVPDIKSPKSEPSLKAAAPAAAPPASTLPAVAPVGKPLPTGSDLNDPVNFGVLPDLALLTPGSLDEMAFRDRLSAEIARANKILHTPKVPAAVWRAWRQFEQQATERLRSSAAVVEEPPPIAAEAPPAVAVKPPAATEISSEEKHESKSFNSLFVEAARALLPAADVDRINRAAEIARKEDTSIGFMKHFRRIAESELTPEVLKQVNENANQRSIPPERWRTRRGRGHSSAAAK